jgi:hypothetical protein
MDNVIKTSGTTEQYKLNPGGSISYPFAVKGIVKQNVDTIRTGRIKVYIADFGALDPTDSNSWVTVSYLSPFYGFLPGDYAPSTSNTESFGSFLENPHSYGFWATSPDIGTEVVCIFLYGKKDFGYYIGCIPQPGITHMVPAIGSSKAFDLQNSDQKSYYNGATVLPVTEINPNNSKIDDNPQFFNQPKPVHSFLAAEMFQQGTLGDTQRGPIGSTSQRESPSAVFGVSTPGRIPRRYN